MRVYAIGDVHGHLDLLKETHQRIAEDKAMLGDTTAPVVHVGDYCDRGPNVPGVLDFLIARQSSGEPHVFLKGNHDRMMQLFLQPVRERDPLRDDLHWLQANIGGRSTLAAYGVDVALDRDRADIHRDAMACVPATHIQFLDSLLIRYDLPGLMFCHAGIRPGVPIDQQNEDDLVWIREPFLSDGSNHGPLIVHGHSPVATATHYGNRLNIDSAAAYGGPLTAVVIEDGEVWELTEHGRMHLTPIAQVA
jgi:serine/threonine protein phosphatase 1